MRHPDNRISIPTIARSRLSGLSGLLGVLALLSVVVPFSTHAASQSASTAPRKKLLFLTHPALYKHTSLGPAEQAVTAWGKTSGFDVTTLEGYKQDINKIDLSMISADYLAQYDGLMLMTNGNLPLTEVQKKAIVDFVRNGKAIIGTHCATLTLYDYPEFGEMLGGYYLRSIVPTAQVGKKMGVLKVEDRTHPATKMLGASWTVGEEFYQFGTAPWDASKPTENISQVGRLHIPLAFSRDRVHVLLSLDTEQTDISDLPLLTKGGDYPQAWSRSFGKGRVFYTTLGHRDDIWSDDPQFRAHVVGGIRWALGLEN
jgi:type 1 glutamine amidotransferase